MPACPLIAVEDGGSIERAANSLASGQVVAFPTDTVYGLLAHPDCPAAYRRIYAIKRRPPDQPLALLAHCDSPAAKCGRKLLGLFADLQSDFSSGLLTVVFEEREFAGLPALIAETQPGPVALRLPADAATRSLLGLCGGLLWATSVNVSSQPEVGSRQELENWLAQVAETPALALYSSADLSGTPSRVARLSGGRISWIRP